jgi:hypothetical protein
MPCWDFFSWMFGHTAREGLVPLSTGAPVRRSHFAPVPIQSAKYRIPLIKFFMKIKLDNPHSGPHHRGGRAGSAFKISSADSVTRL